MKLNIVAVLASLFVLVLATCSTMALPSRMKPSMKPFPMATKYGDRGEPLMVATLRNYNNFYYTLDAHFGSDKSNSYKMLLDTNGGLLTVTSTKCSQCSSHPRYDSSKSVTYKPDGRQVQWDLGPFEFLGSLSNDQVGIILENGLDLTIKNVTFAEVVKSNDNGEENYLYNDGMIGLTLYPQQDFTRTYAFPSIMDFLVQQNLVKAKMFSIYLSILKNPNESHQRGKGSLILGGYSNQYYQGQIGWNPIPKHAKHWSVEFDGLKVNGQLANYLNCGNGTGIKCIAQFDTAVYAMFTDTETYGNLELYAKLQIPGLCSDVKYSQLPTIAFVIGGRDYEINPHDYVIENKPPLFGPSLCQGAINEGETLRPGEWIFGAVFQSLFYTIYDHQNMRIGLATAKHN